MYKKFQVLILETLFDDGSYRTDNAINGYTVVTKAITPWDERTLVKIGDQCLFTSKKVELKKIIPDNLELNHGERVVIIGADVEGSTHIMGLRGWVRECPYTLGAGVYLVALAEPPGYGYVSGTNLCRTGGPALWKGIYYE